MRLTTFVVGGIVGATAAMYFTRNNHQEFLRAINRAGSNMSKFMNLNNHANPQKLDRVEKMINEDPEVKSSVNEILAENNAGHITQTQ